MCVLCCPQVCFRGCNNVRGSRIFFLDACTNYLGVIVDGAFLEVPPLSPAGPFRFPRPLHITLAF